MSLFAAKPYATAHWKLDETSGTRYDSVGTSHLSDNNTVAYADGKFSYAADFEESNSEYLTVTDNSAVSTGSGHFVIRAWVKFESLSGNMVIAGKWGAAGTREYVLWYDFPANRLKFTVVNPSDTQDSATADNLGAPSTGVWYLIHAWHDAAGQIGIAVNAGTANTASHSGGIRDGSNNFTLGRSDDGGTIYLDGLVDDVVILKGYLLSAAERSDDYNNGLGIAYADWPSTTNSGRLALPYRGQFNRKPTWRYPELWRGCIGAWCPKQQGPAGTADGSSRLHDYSPYHRHASFGSGGFSPTYRVDHHTIGTGSGYSLYTQDPDNTQRSADVSGFPFLTAPFTIAFWGYNTRLESAGDMYCNAVTRGSVFDNDTNFAVGWRSNGDHHTHCFWRSGATLYGNEGGNLGPSGAGAHKGYREWWHHLAFVIQPNWDVVAYIDGQQAWTDTGNSAPGDGGQALRIGLPTTVAGTDTGWAGSLDDIRIYNRALPPGEIQLLARRRGIAYEKAKRVSVYPNTTALIRARNTSATIHRSYQSVNWQQPINWAHPLNKGRLHWWMVVPHWKATYLRDLAKLSLGTFYNDITANTNGPDFDPHHSPGGWGGINFDGSNDVIRTARTLPTFNAADPFTLHAWIRTTNSTATDRMMVFTNYDGGESSGGQWLFLRVGNGTSLVAQAGVGNDITWQGVSGTTVVNDGNWHFLCAVRNSDQSYTMYVDGKNEGSTASPSYSSSNALAPFLSGLATNPSRNPGQVFLGQLNDWGILARAWSPSEVLEYYELSKRGYGSLLNRTRRTSALTAAGGVVPPPEVLVLGEDGLLYLPSWCW